MTAEAVKPGPFAVLPSPLATAILLFLAAWIFIPYPGSAQVQPDAHGSPLAALVRQSDRLHPGIALEEMDKVRSSLAPAVDAAWSSFRQENGAAWTAYVDARSGRIESAEGEGIPWIPGAGNRLVRSAGQTIDLATLEGIARRFVDEQASLLGLDSKALVLASGRSGKVAGYLWYVDFDVIRGGLPIEGARVVFRVNNGNLIQFGLENLPPAEVPVPKVATTREQAFQIVADSIGGFLADDTILDAGSLHLLPSAESDARFAEGFAFGRGYGLAAVWEVTFRREGDLGTWRARVDASRGELLEFSDLNHYSQAKSTGGVVIGDPRLTSDVIKPMPHTDLSNATYTASTGRFPPVAGPLSSKLDGLFVRISDRCGAILATTDQSGNLPFGWQLSDTTDCQTSGVGGWGNTRSSRTTFYWVNRAKEFARGWLPSLNWLWQKLTVNVNGDPLCNAFWNGQSLNFFKGELPCRNTGELPGVAIHEFGHGLDSNDGSGTADLGTGESTGDFLSALMLHTSCVGEGFLPSDCDGFGDGCIGCTGVRDIDFAHHESNTRHTVGNFVQPLCPTSSSYRGPCGREGHCESIIPSETVWDFVNRKLPNPGGAAAWNVMERLWFLSRPTATQSFTCNTNQATWNADGCNIGSLWKVLRAADDDDGNLANGTPHGTALFQAFLDHGISCYTDPGTGITFSGCTPPPTPVVTATALDEQVQLSWASAGSQFVYDIYRNDLGCNAGFTRIEAGYTDSLTDDLVVNGQRYYYQVVGHRAGNEACASAPSACQQVVPNVPQPPPPCVPPAMPTFFIPQVSSSEIDLQWTTVPGAVRYRVFTSAVSLAGPFDEQTTVNPWILDAGKNCNTNYFYAVRAERSDTCFSATTAPVQISTLACPRCTTTTLYSNNFEKQKGLSDWIAGPGGKYWRGVQTCSASSGTDIFRFGGATCTDDYPTNQNAYAQPHGLAGIAIPAGAASKTLTFSHRRGFDSATDGGTLAVSVNGGPYNPITSGTITSGGYTGTVNSVCAPAGTLETPIWAGTSAGFTSTTVDLSSYCPPGGCSGAYNLGIAFKAITDCAGNADGWFLDDVKVTACVN